MILKLRIKLILASILSLAAVLSLIVGLSVIVSYQKLVTESDQILDILARNNGSFPSGSFDASPELPFESRYFYVQFTDDGILIAANTEKIAAIDHDTAVNYAEEILLQKKESGFIGRYRYTVETIPEGNRVLFLDCSRSLKNFQNFFLTSVIVSLLGMTAVLVLIVFFSKRIIDPVAESYKKQRQFITDAGHELKTPLAIINADADVLEMETGANEWLHDIKMQTKRLTGLTNDLISLSRMEEIQSQTNMAAVSFSELAQDAVQSFQSMALAQEKTFTARIEPGLKVLGDEKSLARLLSILLDNALKYCPSQGTIDFKLEHRGKQLRLELTNTADSIDPADLPHLFDRFYRADRSRNSENGGYGIGLSIAGAIVAAHKGKITASTKDRRSLTMTVALPGN